MIKRIISAAVIMTVTSQYADAQTLLHLNDAVKHALEFKSDAIKARLDIENSEYLIQEVKANALPQLNAQGSVGYNAILQQMAMNLNGQTMVIKMGQPWQINGAVQLDQTLFNMSVFEGLKAAKTTREFYQINATLTEEQIIEKVTQSYYEVYKTKSQLLTIDKAIANTERIKNILTSLYENGLAKKIDLDRIQVALNNLKSSRQQLVNAIQLQENALKYLIGMDIKEPITLAENTFDIDKYIQIEKIDNVENRTEIQMLEKQGELLRLNKKSIEAQRYPSLAFSANYGYMGLGEKMPFFYGKADGVNWSDFSTLTLALRVPIFSGFRMNAQISQAQIEIEKFEADLHDTKLALSLAQENAYTQINNSLITLNVQKENMELARQVLVNVENNYNNGLASLTDLLDAENSYAEAQNNYTSALMDYKLAEIQLLKSRGELKSYFIK